MKTRILILLILLGSISLKMQGQINYQHSFSMNQNIGAAYFAIIDIGNNNYKYMFQDNTGFRLFNLDYSLYLANVAPPIPLFQPPNYNEAMYITQTLFDCDSTNIEYAICSETHPGNFYIYRTDGTLLFEKDSAIGACEEGGGFYALSTTLRPIETTPDGTKLYLWTWNSTGLDSLIIYSLCGDLPTMFDEIKHSPSYVQVFPNPTDRIINFNINPPNNFDQFTLTIYNSSFQQVHKMDVKEKNVQLDLKEKSLASGTYLFDLRTNNKVFQTGKFVIER